MLGIFETSIIIYLTRHTHTYIPIWKMLKNFSINFTVVLFLRLNFIFCKCISEDKKCNKYRHVQIILRRTIAIFNNIFYNFLCNYTIHFMKRVENGNKNFVAMWAPLYTAWQWYFWVLKCIKWWVFPPL